MPAVESGLWMTAPPRQMSAPSSSVVTPRSHMHTAPIPELATSALGDSGGDRDSASSVRREAPCFRSSLEALTGDASKGKEGAIDQTQTGVLNLWWGLIQDQMGTLTREIDALRLANSQIQARQTEALMNRSDPHGERVNE